MPQTPDLAAQQGYAAATPGGLARLIAALDAEEIAHDANAE